MQLWRGKRGRTNYMVHHIPTPVAGMERKERQNKLHGSSHNNTGCRHGEEREAERTTWFITYQHRRRHREESRGRTNYMVHHIPHWVQAWRGKRGRTNYNGFIIVYSGYNGWETK